LWPVNVDDAKSDVMSSLALQVREGPNVTHFPARLEETVNEEYFSQLTAEHKETRYNKAKVATHTVWVQDRERNEALDMAVLCLAARRLLNPNIRQMFELLAATPAPNPNGEQSSTKQEASAPQPPRPMRPRDPRRVVRSNYLRR
jgi:phage terminase large subunit GpA-like protein